MHIAFVVGLERVAEELMGRRKWKQYQDAVLKTPLKVDTEDWEPQDKCCMCDGRPFLDLATVSRSLNQIVVPLQGNLKLVISIQNNVERLCYCSKTSR